MGCKPEGSSTNLFAAAGGSSYFCYWRIRMRPCPSQDNWGMHKGRAQHSQQPKSRQLLCYPSNYFCILAFCIYRQVCHQRSLFSVLKALMLQSKDSENDCWVLVTTINAVTMKEELFIETVSSPAPFEGNYKLTATIHVGSSARLRLLTNCSCNSNMTECKSSQLRIKSS